MAPTESRDASTSREDAANSECSPYMHRSVPAPPPPSPALGAMLTSPSSMRNLLGKSPVLRERSQSWGHRSSPYLSAVLTPPYSPIATTTTLPTGGVPFMPNLVLNQSTSAGKSAMEQTMQEERQRRIRKERDEVDLDANQLRAILKDERIRMSRIAAELAQLKSTAVASQLESEVHEEGRINCLMRQLDNVHREKGRIIHELELEEAMVTNTLQKKLAQVKKEKALLEQKIRKEQISHSELESKLGNVHLAGDDLQTRPLVDETIEECDDEGEVDDSILPDLAAQAELED